MVAPHACTQRDARDSGVDLRRALTGWSCRSGSDPRPLELNHLHADRVPPVLDPDRLLSSEFQPICQFGGRFLETVSVPFSADVAVEAEAPPTMDAKVNAETGPFLPRSTVSRIRALRSVASNARYFTGRPSLIGTGILAARLR